MSIVNTGIEPDRLVSASSPAAASVEISGDTEIPAGRVLLIEGEPEPPAAAPSGAARPTGSPAASPAPAEPSGEPTTPGDEIGSAGQEGQTRAAEPTSAAPSTPRSGTGGAESGGAQGQIVLTGLTEDIRAGLTYPVVLNFERAGQIRLAVPVGYPERAPRGRAPPSELARPRRPRRVPLHRVRAPGRPVGRPLPVLPGVGQPGADRPGRAGPARTRIAAGAPTAPARRIADVALDTARARPTGVSELDRVLGGGLVPGSVVLLAGEPGVGKSTLLLEVAAQAAERGRVLYVTGEESAGQVRLRAERTGGVHDELYLAAESDLGAVVGHIDALAPAAAGGRLGADDVHRRTPTARPAGSPRPARSRSR